MAQPTVLPAYAGATLAYPLGHVTVLLSRVGTDANPAFRAATLHGSTGAEIDQLSESFPTERVARGIARALSILFLDSRTAAQVVDEVASYAKPGQRTALAIIDAALDHNALRASCAARWAEERLLLAVRDELEDAAVRADVDRGLDAMRRHLLATTLRDIA